MLLEDGKTRTRGWNAARWWRNANSWLQDLKTQLERTRNAARRRRHTNFCSQDLEALLEDLVPVAHLPDGYPTAPGTIRTFWNITRDHRARLVWTNRDFFHILQFTYLLTSLHFLTSLYVYTWGILGCLLGIWPLPKPCGGNNSFIDQTYFVTMSACLFKILFVVWSELQPRVIWFCQNNLFRTSTVMQFFYWKRMYHVIFMYLTTSLLLLATILLFFQDNTDILYVIFAPRNSMNNEGVIIRETKTHSSSWGYCSH